MTTIDVVIPTVDRSCLGRLLASIERERVHERGRVIVVDDRPGTTALELYVGSDNPAGRTRTPRHQVVNEPRRVHVFQLMHEGRVEVAGRSVVEALGDFPP